MSGTPNPGVSAAIVMVPVAQVRTQRNDRIEFDDLALRQLAASIRAEGLIEPIIVRPARVEGDSVVPLAGHEWHAGETPDFDGVYLLVAGERRLRAHRLLGNEWIAAIVEPATDERAKAVMLLENLNRVQLNPIEEARAYQSRMNEFGYSAELMAEKAAVSPGVVRGRLELLKLTDEMQFLVATGQIKLTYAARIAPWLDHNRQRVMMLLWERNPDISFTEWEGAYLKLWQEQEADKQGQAFDPELFWSVESYEAAGREARKLGVTGLVKLARELLEAVEAVPVEANRPLVARARVELAKFVRKTYPGWKSGA